ncbi:dTDP-4-dehydrorhamnose reductase [Rhabdaerophilum calidifontis]|uniref:dTDP-4-dehydrorhamnose reductase n=1 Tax=Rhabdaerophilum calidifontis TaxID=2604328 RepID=UPI00319EB3C7
MPASASAPPFRPGDPAMRIAVTGNSGQLVSALAEAAGAAHELIRFGRPALDLAAPDAIETLLAAARPDLLVNAAAYTGVDAAEREPDLARRINALAPGRLAFAAARAGIPIIQISTDYVFDGRKSAPYDESDPVAPLSAYGRTKREGEIAVAAGNPRHLVLRTAWLYDHARANFVTAMLRLAETRPEIPVVADQIGSPTSAADLAEAILRLAPAVVAMAEGDPRFGLYHLAGSGEASRAGFAEAIFAGAAQRGLKAARVLPVTTAEYPLPAPRPADSRLDCRRIARAFGVRLPDWRDALARCLDRIGPAGLSGRTGTA